jgi:hypothetical protein
VFLLLARLVLTRWRDGKMDIAHKTDKMVKWKVSLCDEADFLVSTFEVEAFSSHSALMMALLEADPRLEIRCVVVEPNIETVPINNPLTLLSDEEVRQWYENLGKVAMQPPWNKVSE